MMSRLAGFLLPCIIFVQAALPTAAQGSWKGDFDVDFGSNYHSSLDGRNSQHNGGLSGSAEYESERFKLGLSGSGSYDYLFSGMLGLTLKNNGQDTTGSVDSSTNEVESKSLKSGVNLLWKLSEADKLSFDYNYSHNNRSPVNYTTSTDRLPDYSGKVRISFAKETSDKVTNKHDASISYVHNLDKPGNYLQASLKANISSNNEYSVWNTGEGTGEDIKAKDVSIEIYRTTPWQFNRDFELSALYSSKDFAKVRDLNIDFSYKLTVHGLEEHQRQANYIGGEWVDSTSVSENYLYRTLTSTPMIELSYKVGIFRLDFKFSPELHLRKLDSDENIGDIDKGAFAFPFKLVNTLDPWKGHSFKLSAERSESRPSYLQICWFPRLKSVYANEYYMGNPDLDNAITNKGDFSYKYSHGRFSSTLSYGHVYKKGKIEQTYNTQELYGKECRVYTWINGGYSHENNVKLRLAWKDKRFSASAEGRFNYYRGVKNSGSETRSSDYSLSADAAFNTGKWRFSANADYQSDIIRSYSSITSIIDVGARIERKFEKSTLFLEGRNLADRPIRKTTYSEDGKEWRVEESRNNLRLIVFGAHFDF